MIYIMMVVIAAGVHPQETSPAIRLSGSGWVTPSYDKEYGCISIGDYYFNPLEAQPNLPADLRGASDYYLVHLKGPVYETMKEELALRGVEIIQYIPFNAFICRIPAGKAVLEGLAFINWVGAYEPAYKLHPLFKELKNEDRMLVRIFYNEDIDQAVERLQALGGQILDVSVTQFNKLILIRCDRKNLSRVAGLAAVWSVEPWLDAVAYNNDGQWVTQTWQQENRRLWAKGVQGQGQVVSTADTGILVSHNMFRDPAVAITTWGNFPTHRKIIGYRLPTGSSAAFGDDAGGSWHGTHTAGTISGDDSYVSGTATCDGMPYKAKMYFMDIGMTGGGLSVPADLTNLYNQPYTGNTGGAARVSSHSWGNTSGGGSYTSYCVNTDQFMWNYKDFLICYAAGNSGPGSTTVMPPGTSKDIVTCGAVGNASGASIVAAFSSRGPCLDTRLKPTVTAPGASLKSSVGSGNANYSYMAGTSMATPCIAGNAALVRTYFARGFYPTGDSVVGNRWTYISAAMVKACLINGASAEIQGSTIPDNNTGWGRVLLDDVLFFSNDVRKLAVWDDTTGVSTGQYREYTVTVNNQAEPLKITTVWTDYPATSGANPTIVNNLDLLVTGPGGTTYHGNQYTGGQSTPNPSAYDNRNLEENVRRNTPEIGTWTIRVTGTNVPSGTRQAFAVITSGGLGVITTPVLSLAGKLIQDPSPSNGRVDPGETVYLTDTIKNQSNAGVTNCSGRLRTASAYITLLDTIGTFGALPVGGSAHNGTSRFRFTASASTPKGTFIPFTLHLTADAGFSQDIEFGLMVGTSGIQIIWGPKQVQIPAGDSHFLYGMGYNPNDNRLYVTSAYTRHIPYYTSDTMPTLQGYIPAPDTMATDVKYCSYDNTFWVAANPAVRRVYKINPSGTILRQFNNPANDYPTGLTWVPTSRLLYLSDRRTATTSPPEYIYRSDTLGTATQLTIPWTGNVGARGLATEPYGPDTTILMIYTFFNAGATNLDSVSIIEMQRSNLAVLNSAALPGWNARGCEYDPRDGNYWISLCQNPDRSIGKIAGFRGIPIGIVEHLAGISTGVSFAPVIPNPFRGRVTFAYCLPSRQPVRLTLYDAAGRLVSVLVDRTEPAGSHSVVWKGLDKDGSAVASGVYFCRLEAGETTLVRKVIATR